MLKMMFVCHGNICRSPMAEFIMKKMVEENDLQSLITVASSATSTEEIIGNVGNPVYPPAKAELKKHGISCDEKRAVRLQKSDYDKYDLFIGMDAANIRNMHRILGDDPQGKIKKLLDYTENGGDVADPWYTGNFDVTYDDVREGCAALLQHILNSEK